MMDIDLGSIAAQAAEDIEAADSAEDAQLVGDAVQDVRFDVGLDGQVREVSVSFNAAHTRVTVDLHGAALTVAAGGDTHRTHINDDGAAVLAEAARWWESHIQGVSVRT